MDEITTAGNIRQEVIKYLGELKNEIEVRNLRPLGNSGTQMATLLLDDRSAEKIATIGKIRIGLSNCRAKLRADILTCYRCWQTGHLATNCVGFDRSRL